MVGRLVKQQQVVVAQEQSGQRDSTRFATGQPLGLGGEVDAGQQGGDRGPGARVTGPHVRGPSTGDQIAHRAGQPVLLGQSGRSAGPWRG